MGKSRHSHYDDDDGDLDSWLNDSRQEYEDRQRRRKEKTKNVDVSIDKPSYNIRDDD